MGQRIRDINRPMNLKINCKSIYYNPEAVNENILSDKLKFFQL